MGVFGEKNAILIDLDRGIVGTFVGTENQGTESGFVYPTFTPFNSLRKIKYSKAIPAIAIHHVYPHGDEDHIQKHIVFILEGKEGSMMHFIDKKNQQTIKELKDRIHDLEIENAGSKQRAEEAYTGAEKVVSRQKQMAKAGPEKRPGDPMNVLSHLRDDW